MIFNAASTNKKLIGATTRCLRKIAHNTSTIFSRPVLAYYLLICSFVFTRHSSYIFDYIVEIAISIRFVTNLIVFITVKKLRHIG